MTQITEDYVSFETAKLLKEKGFDEATYRAYIETNKEHQLSFDVGRNNSQWEKINKENGVFNCSAPTIQMTMKWLRERNIVICVIPFTFYCGETVGAWGYNIWADDNLGIDGLNPNKFATYEEACESAIKYCLKKLI